MRNVKMIAFVMMLALVSAGCGSQQQHYQPVSNQREVYQEPAAWAMEREQSLLPKLDALFSISEPGLSGEKKK